MANQDDSSKHSINVKPLSIEQIAEALAAPPFDENAAVLKIREAFRAADPNNPEHLHQLLDIIFTLRDLSCGDSNGIVASLAHEGAAILIHGGLGWARRSRPEYAESIEALEAEPRRWQQELYTNLERGTDLIPDWLARPLISALVSLGDGSGEVPHLLVPTPRGGGHGRNPPYAAHMERVIVSAVYYEAGRGLSVEKAQEVLAARAGVGPAALKQWEQKWYTTDADSLKFNRKAYRARGKAGQPFRDDGATIEMAIRDRKLARSPAPRVPTKRGE